MAAAQARKILVVEDSPMMIQLYRMVLGASGEDRLLFASNGVEALDLAAQEPDVDLFIVDINMPQMDGLEFLRRLRGELGRARVPAIVVSTEDSEADREAARAAGADAYLAKPWRPDELLALVASQAPTGSAPPP